MVTLSDLLGVAATCRSYAPKMSESAAILPFYDWYALTVTVDRHAKYKNRLIYKMLPHEQINAMYTKLKTIFDDGFNYYFRFEFTKKGIIHAHGIVSHKTYKSYNDIVMHTIKQTIQRIFGRIQDCRPVSNMKSWMDYINKEYREDNKIGITNIDSDMEAGEASQESVAGTADSVVTLPLPSTF